MNVSVLTTPANAPPSPAKVEAGKTSQLEEKSFSEALENTIQEEDLPDESPKSADDISTAAAVITPVNIPVNVLMPVIEGQDVQINLLDGQNAGSETPQIPILDAAQSAGTDIPEISQPGISDTVQVLASPFQVEVEIPEAQSSVDMLKSQDVGIYVQGIGSSTSQQEQQVGVNPLVAPNLDDINAGEAASQMTDLEETRIAQGDSFSNLQGLASLISTKLNDSEMVENEISLHIQQVVHVVKNMVEGSRQVLQIRLHPDNLGTIQVKLVNSADGIQVYMNAEKPSTSRMLENNLSQLQDLLLQTGVKIGGMTVGNSQQDMQNNLFGWQANTFQNSFRSSMSEERNSAFETRDVVVASTSALDSRA